VPGAGQLYASVMQGGAGRHAELVEELVEWWEDLWQRGMTSRVVLVAVPPGWGRSAVLDRLAEAANADDAPVTLIVRVNGRELPAGQGLQAAALRECLAQAADSHRVAELLGMDRLGGAVQMGIGIGGLFVSGLAAGVGFLLAGIAVAASGKAWDDSPGGQDGAVARAARATATVSVRVPVIVIIDDADCLDQDLAVALIENLAARHDGHVLTVAAVDAGSPLNAALVARSRMGITEGLVHVAEADPDMGLGARESLTRELCPRLPDAAVRRVARGTVTFTDVFAVSAAPRLADISAGQDGAEILAAVDSALAALAAGEPSREAVAIAWAGGLLHARQATRALAALGPEPAGSARDVLRWAGLERLAAPASPRLAAQVAALAAGQRRAMAAATLEEARAITIDQGCGLVDRVAAAQAAHRVRRDLTDRGLLPSVQRALAAGLEQLGEPAIALEIAVTALAEWPSGGDNGDRDWLAAAVLRLSRLVRRPLPPDAAWLIDEATGSGAITSLEARIWAAVSLLEDADRRDAALAMIDLAAADLNAHADILGDEGARWRLLLAYHAGRAGHPAVTAQILAPLLNSGQLMQEDAARAVLRVSGGPHADTRLQDVILAAELVTLPLGADDDRLRIHHALAANHDLLGEYRQALAHGQNELELRHRIHGPDHPGTLTARGGIARWTGQCGDAAGALRLSLELLPDEERVLGHDHPETLETRNNIAAWTGYGGDQAGALRLFLELLPDQQRVLGPRSTATLTTRGNIAQWTGQCGDAAGALRLFLRLLPDEERALGPDHTSTMATRGRIAHWGARCGDAAGALRVAQGLLPDQQRVLGPDHPETLLTRSDISTWTGQGGDAAGALRLARGLLPDQERVLGPDHRHTLATRNNIASWTGQCGDAAAALRLFLGLLPDRERVQGADHPDTLATRNNMAAWTSLSGDPVGALRLFLELLPDQERVLGPDHPATLTTRNNIAYLINGK
jgi:hypothetical protein